RRPRAALRLADARRAAALQGRARASPRRLEPRAPRRRAGDSDPCREGPGVRALRLARHLRRFRHAAADRVAPQSPCRRGGAVGGISRDGGKGGHDRGVEHARGAGEDRRRNVRADGAHQPGVRTAAIADASREYPDDGRWICCPGSPQSRRSDAARGRSGRARRSNGNRVTLYHVTQSLLAPGSVILPGNFGRILALYRMSDVNALFYRERILEEIMLREIARGAVCRLTKRRTSCTSGYGSTPTRSASAGAAPGA